MPRDDITGFILAGGRGRRMGQDKAGIAWGSGTLVTRAVRCMQQVVSSVFIVGGQDESRVPVLKDVFPESGPLGGIHSALAHSTSDWNLILAVDMPLVTAPLLEFLAAQCHNEFLAVVPYAKGAPSAPRSSGSNAQERLLQPLCAAYRRRLLPLIERALASRELSIHRLLDELQAGIMNEQGGSLRLISEAELGEAGFSGNMLLNVNTRSDLEQARILAGVIDV